MEEMEDGGSLEVGAQGGEGKGGAGKQQWRGFQKVQKEVFGKVVNLKKYKIQLLDYYSRCLDHKYKAENTLREIVQEKQRKQKHFVSKQESYNIVFKNAKLRAEEQELKRKVAERKSVLFPNADKSRAKTVLDISRHSNIYRSNLIKSNHSLAKLTRNKALDQSSSQIDSDNLVDIILSQIKTNQQLENKQLELHRTLPHKITNQIKQKQQSIGKWLHHQQQKSIRSASDKYLYDLDNQKLIEFINEQQQQKRQLFIELQEARKQMEDMIKQNKKMRKMLDQQLYRSYRESGKRSKLSMTN